MARWAGLPPGPMRPLSPPTPRAAFFLVRGSLLHAPDSSPCSFLELQPPWAPPCVPGPGWPSPPLLGSRLKWAGLGPAKYKVASGRQAAPTSLLKPYPRPGSPRQPPAQRISTPPEPWLVSGPPSTPPKPAFLCGKP